MKFWRIKILKHSKIRFERRSLFFYTNCWKMLTFELFKKSLNWKVGFRLGSWRHLQSIVKLRWIYLKSVSWHFFGFRVKPTKIGYFKSQKTDRFRVRCLGTSHVRNGMRWLIDFVEHVLKVEKVLTEPWTIRSRKRSFNKYFLKLFY